MLPARRPPSCTSTRPPLENGCLEVVPGSHRSGRLPTRTDMDVFGANEMDPVANADLERVSLPLPAGSVVLFGAFLAHATGPNRTDTHRRALLYSYQPAAGHHMLDELRPHAAALLELTARARTPPTTTSARYPRSATSPRAAGVSPATVSRVLNGTGTVAPERAAAVHRAARELGYTPSGPARALRQQKARVWAAIIADIENPFFTAMVRGIEDVARSVGHRLVLCNSDEDLDKETAYLDIALAEQMAGVVIAVASDKESRLDGLLDRGCLSSRWTVARAIVSTSSTRSWSTTCSVLAWPRST